MIPVDHHTYAQTKMKIDFCMLLHHTLHWAVNETIQFMRLCFTYVPLAHAASEGSDESAHPLSLARGITAHIHNEGACLSPTRWLSIMHQ